MVGLGTWDIIEGRLVTARPGPWRAVVSSSGGQRLARARPSGTDGVEGVDIAGRDEDEGEGGR